MSEKELNHLCRKVSLLFEIESAVTRLHHKQVIFVGDLHGDLEALDFILKAGKTFEDPGFVFLGDYVDRGKNSVEVLCRLFRLKTEHPWTTILLRGNHETAQINTNYGFYDEIGRNEELFIFVNRTFDKMPIAAVVNDSVFCAHGGIGNPVNLEDIKKENCYPYLWNDPCNEPGLNFSEKRRGALAFGPDICHEFLRKNGLDMIIRAHTELEEGYQWWFDRRLLSIFSIPDYCGRKGRGAFAVMEKGNIETFVFARDEDGPYSLIGSGD